MSYKAKISKTANGIKEKKSVLFIESLLVDAPAKTKLETEDTGANIDGFIELLNEEGRILGKVTVQVKTVNKNDEGKNRYPCPTSLFAHAEATTDIVLLIAVDHSQNIALWKYISQTLLRENLSRKDQETIVVHFEKDEQLSVTTLLSTLQTWRTISQREVKMNQTAAILSDENEELRKQILHSQNSNFTIVQDDIIKIQQFSDAYNQLLDDKFRYIKEAIFPKCWKRGLAIYKFEDTKLYYSLFNIKYGENSLLIKELPEYIMSSSKDDFLSCQYLSNKIKESPASMAVTLVKNHVNKFIKQQLIIPTYDEFILEYVHDFCLHSNHELHINSSMLTDISKLISHLQYRYPDISNMPYYSVHGHKQIHLNTLYDCLLFLRGRGYTEINPVYPERGHYADSGWVSDWFSPELAFQKLKIVMTTVYNTYSNFIANNFPLLTTELDCYHGANIVAVDIEYIQGSMPNINICFLKSQISDDTKQIFFSRKEESQLLKENEVDEYFKLWKLPLITYQGKLYNLLRTQGCDAQKYLFDRYNFLSTFYDILEEQMNEYFNSLSCD